jgi:hypothetical protein
MSRKKKVPVSVQRVVNKLLDGQKLCRQRTPESGEIFYFFEPGGRRCGPKTAEKAISMGLVKPAGDDLFSESNSQTWVAA